MAPNQAQAAPARNVPATAGFDPSWTVMPGLQANWNDGTGATAGTGNPTYLNTDSVYFISDNSANNLGTVGATSWVLGEQIFSNTPDANGNLSYTTRGVMSITRTAAAPTGMPAYYPFDAANQYQQFDTIAMAPRGGKLNPIPDPDTTDPSPAPLTMYFWADPGTNHFNTSFLNCGAKATALGKPAAAGMTVVRITSGDPKVYGGCAMAPSMGGTFPPAVTVGYATGGEADQLTGLVYFDAMYGQFDSVARNGTGLNAATQQFGIWDPETGNYAQSGPVQPADLVVGQPSIERNNLQYDPQSNAAATPNVSADMGLDALGNIYQYATGASVPNAAGNGGATVIRVVPATDGNGHFVNGSAANPWKYNVVKKLTKATPDMYIQSGEVAVGMGIHNGKLLAGGYYNTYSVAQGFPNCTTAAGCATSPNPYAVNTSASRMMQIDPMSGVMSVIGSTANANFLDTPNGNSAVGSARPGGYRDNSSPQMLTVIEGTVYNDANANGAIDDGEAGLVGQTMAIYNSANALVGTQTTDSAGHYAFIVSGNGTYTVQLSQPRINGVNAVQTYAGRDDSIDVGGNSTTFACVPQGTLTGTGGACSGALTAPFIASPLGAIGSTADPATFPIYATVTMSDYAATGEADFGVTTAGSYGDATAGPTSVTATPGAPVHVNGLTPSIWLGASLGSYPGPATTCTAGVCAHDATDDGLYIGTQSSLVGRVSIDKTLVLAAARPYDLKGTVSGPAAASPSTYVTGWTTPAGSATWNTAPVWSPSATSVASGTASGTFVPSQSVATGLVQLRASVSTGLNQAIANPVNSANEYQAVPTSTTQYWTTPGEIEDYQFQVAAAVYRPAVVTNGGVVPSVTVTPVTPTGTAQTFTSVGTQAQVGTGYGVANATAPVVTVTVPAGYIVSAQAVDTESGETTDVNTGAAIPQPTVKNVTGPTSEIDLGALATSQDVTLLITFNQLPDPAKSTFSCVPTSPLTADTVLANGTDAWTCTATAKNTAGDLLANIAFDFSTDPGSPVKLSAPDCVTGTDGTCNVSTAGTLPVTATSTVAGDNFNIFAKVDAVGDGTGWTDVSGSPQPVAFQTGAVDLSQSSFTVSPAADLGDPGTWVKVSDTTGTGYAGTLTLKDANGNAVTDADTTAIGFAFSRTDGSISVSSVANNHDGTYTVHFTSKVADSSQAADLPSTSTVTATYGGANIAKDPAAATKVYAQPVPFAAGPAGDCPDPSTASRIAADQTSLGVGETSTITVYVTDQFCNAVVDGTPVTIAATSANTPPSTTFSLAPAGPYTTTGGQIGLTLTDHTAGTINVAASVTGATVADSPLAITFIKGAPSVACSSFTVSPVADPSDGTKADWALASDPAGTGYTGTLTLCDASGNRVDDAAFDATTGISFTPSRSDVSVTGLTNNHDGTYTVKFTSEVSDEVIPATTTVTATYAGATIYQDPAAAAKVSALPIPFRAGCLETGTAGTDNSRRTQVSVTTNGVVADNSAADVATVKLFDQFGNPSDYVCTVSGGVTTMAPAVITTVPSSAAVTASAPVHVSEGVWTIEYASGTAATYTATVLASGTEIAFTQDPGATPQLTPAQVAAKSSPVSLTFTAGTVSEGWSEMTVDKPSATAGDPITATVTAKDGSGNLVGAGMVIDFTVSSPSGKAAVTGDSGVAGLTATCTTDANSQCTVKTTDTVADETVTLHGLINGQDIGTGRTPAAVPALDSPKSLTFTPGAPQLCTDPTGQGWLLSVDRPATGVGTSATVSAYITDQYCNPVADGTVVSFAASPNSPAILVPVGGGQTVDGTATATLTDTKAETVTVTATAGTPAIAVPNGTGATTGVTVQFTEGGPDHLLSTFTVDPVVNLSDPTSWVSVGEPGGTSYYTGTLHLVDSNLNDLASYDTSAMSFIPSDTVNVKVSSVVNAGNGLYTVQFTSENADAATTARVTLDGTPVGAGATGTVKLIPFKAGLPGICTDPTPAKPASNLTVDKDTAQVNENVTATAYITDQYCNPVDPGVTVTFTATNSGKLGTDGTTWTPATLTAQTVAGGNATMLVTDSHNETVNVQAAVPINGTLTTIYPTAGLDIAFGHGVVSADNSRISVSPSTSPAGSMVTVSVTLHDAENNPIEDLTAADFAIAGTSAGLADATWGAAPWTYSGGNGTYTRQATSTVPGLYTFGGMVTGVQLNANHPADQATFVPGEVCTVPVAGVDAAHTTRFGLGVDGSPANGTTANTIIAYAFDCYGNAVANASFTLTDQTSGAAAGKLTPSSETGTTASDGTGKGTASFTTLVASQYTVAGTFATSQGNVAPSVGATLITTFSAGNAAGGSISIETLNNTVGDVTYADITTTDANGNKVGGVAVVLTASSPNVSLNNGTSAYTCTSGATGAADEGTCKVPVTAKLVGDYTVAATLGTGGAALTGSPAPVSFASDNIVCVPATDTCTPVDPTHITHLQLTTDGSLDNGSAQNVVTVWAYDRYGNPLPGKPVTSTAITSTLTVVSAGAAGTHTSGPTDASGRATVGYTSMTPGEAQASVSVDGKEIKSGTAATSSPVTMTFALGQGDPDHSRIDITPSAPQAVDSQFTITATVHDSSDHPVGGVLVAFVPDAGLAMTDAVTGQPATSCTTAATGIATGTCQVTVTATIAKTYNVGATILNASNAQQAVQNSPVQATFTAGPICLTTDGCAPDPGVPDSQKTSVTMDINGVAPDGSSRNTAVAQAFDKHGNPIDGVQFTATTTDAMTILPIATTVGGEATISFTSTVTPGGVYTANVTVPNASNVATTVPGSPVTVVFGQGQLSDLTFTVTPKVAGTPTPLVVGDQLANTYTVTATATDPAGDPAVGTYVTFEITPAGPTWTSVTGCTTVSTGTCSVDVYSTHSGSYNVTAKVGSTPYGGSKAAIWVPGPVCAEGCTPKPGVDADHTTKVWMTTDNETADGQHHNVATVRAMDQWGNPVGSVVVKATATDPSTLTVQSGISGTDATTGQTTIWFTSTVAGPATAHVTVDTDNKEVDGGNLLSMTFTPGNPSATNSTLTVDSYSATVGGYVTATATVKDGQGNLVPGVTVTFDTTKSGSASPQQCVTGDGSTGKPLGVCTSQISDNVAETTTVTATIPVAGVDTLIQPGAGLDVVFGFGAVDPKNSTITVSPSAAQKTGAPVTVTVTAHDAQNNAITNLTPAQIVVTASAAGLPDLVLSSFTNMGDGTYTATTTSTVPGTFAFSATVANVALTQHPTAAFVAGDVCVAPQPGVDAAHTTRFTVEVDGAMANGQARDTVKAWAFDCYGNPTSGAVVTLTDTTTTAGLVGKLSQVNAAPVVTGADGTVSVDFTATAAGSYSLQGDFDGLQPPATAAQTLIFVPGNVNAYNSTMTLDKTSATVGAPVTATITTMDGNGSLVGGVTVALSSNPTGVSFSTTCVTSNVTTSPAFGTCTVPFTSQFAHTYAISAQIGGTQIGGAGDPSKASPQNVAFTADGPCFVDCTPSDDPSTPGDESANYTHVELTKDGALDNGTAQNVVTTFVYDKFGNPVQNASVWAAPVTSTLHVAGDGTSAVPVQTGANGQAAIDFTSTMVGEATTRVVVNGTEVKYPTDANLSSPVTMNFSGGIGDPAHSSVTIAPNNGTDLSIGTAQAVDATFTITASVNDATDNPVPDAAVAFTPQTGLTMTDASGQPTTSCVTASTGSALGTCQVFATSTKAGSYTTGATIQNAAGQQQAVVGSPVTAIFTAGQICTTASDPGVPVTNVVMTVNGQKADGSARDVATVSAYDCHGNAVPGAPVASALATGETNLTVQTTPPIAATNTVGQSTIWYTSTANGDHKATVTVGNAALGQVTLPLTMQFGAGTGVAGTITVAPKVAAQTPPLTVGTSDANTYQVKAVINDAFDAPAPGNVVTFTVTPDGTAWVGGNNACTTDATGTCSVYVTSTNAGTFQVTAKLGTIVVGQAQSMAWKTDTVCAADCTPVDPNTPLEKRTRFEVTTPRAVADGNQATAVTVYAFDQYGNAVQGVTISSQPGTGDQGLVVGSSQGTNAAGLAVIAYTSTVAGDHTATLRADGHPVADAAGSQIAKMAFTAGSADAGQSTLVLDKTTSPAGAPVYATVTIYDVNGNRVPNEDVELTVDGSATLADPVTSLTCTTSDGMMVDPATNQVVPLGQCALVSVNDLVAETVQVTASVTVGGTASPLLGGGDPAKASPQSVTFTLACIPAEDPANCQPDDSVDNAHRTQVKVTTDNQTAGLGTDVATVLVFDKYGNPANGRTVTTVGSTPLVTPAARTTGTNGQALLGYTTGTYTAPVTAPAKVMVAGVELVFVPQPGTSPTDPVWNVAANSSPVTVHFLDKTAPAAPAITSPADGALTNDDPVTITGTGEPGATVAIRDNGQPVLDGKGNPVTATVGNDGKWTVPVSLPDGDHTLTAVQTDPSGNASAPSAPVTVTVDTTPPGAPVVDKANSSVITGTVPVPVEPGTTVTVVDQNGDPLCSDVAVNSTTGVWTCQTPPGTPSGDITVTAKDPAGNESDPVTVPLDTVVPGAPSGLSGNDKVITGKATAPVKPGSTVTVTYPKQGGGTGTVTGNVNPDGSFSIPTPADAISGDLSGVVTDPAGNVSAPGTGTLDRTAPGAPSDLSGNDQVITGTVTAPVKPGSTVTVTYPKQDGTTGTVTGDVNPDGTFSIPTPNDAVNGDLSAVVTDPKGNVSDPGTGTLDRTAPGAPGDLAGNDQVITGKVTEPVKPGSTVTVTYPKQGGGTGTVTGDVNPDGSFSIPTPADAVDGDLSAVVTDPKGNVSDPGTGPLDRTAPDAPRVDVANAKEVTGGPGAAEPGSTVTVTFPDGSKKTTTANPDGSYKVDTPAGMPSGDITVTATDPAGNTSKPTTANLDTAAPAKPVVNPSNGTEVSGSGEPHGTVTVTDKNGQAVPGCENVPIDTNGHFVCTPTTRIPQGDTVSVVVTDQAGNPSEPTVLTIGKLAIDVSNPNPKPGDSQTVTGKNFNPGEQVCLTIMSAQWKVGCQTADAQGNVTMTFTIPPNLSVGPHTVTLAGAKSGSVSTVFTVAAVIKTGGTEVGTAASSGGTVSMLYGVIAMLVVGTAGLWLGTAKNRQALKPTR